MYELTDREKQSLAKADELNSYLSMASIPQAAAAARLRSQQQQQNRLQQRARRNDTADLALALGMKQGSGPFEGKSIEAQSINALWPQAQAAGLSREEFMARMAQSRLTRPRVITTAGGSEEIPGMDLGFMGVNSASTFTPRNPSGDEKRGDLAVAQIQSATPGAYQPSFFEEVVQALPAPVANLLSSDAYNLDLTEQRQYLSNLIYLQSGATAPVGEIETRRLEFFPQNNDSPEVLQRKRENLEAFKLDAAAAFKSRGGDQGGTADMSDEDLINHYSGGN